MPLEIEKIIEISDPVYAFSEVMDQIDLKKYLVIRKSKTGRKRFDSEIMLKIILFAFMERGYVSTREMQDRYTVYVAVAGTKCAESYDGG